MRTRSASEWRDFWRERGERELSELLEEFEPHATRIATLLGSRASRHALAKELARIRVHDLGLGPDPERDRAAAEKIADWFDAA